MRCAWQHADVVSSLALTSSMQTQILVDNWTSVISLLHGWGLTNVTKRKECLNMIINVPVWDEGRTEHLTSKVYYWKKVLCFDLTVHSLLIILSMTTYALQHSHQGRQASPGHNSSNSKPNYCTAMLVQNKKRHRKSGNLFTVWLAYMTSSRQSQP